MIPNLDSPLVNFNGSILVSSLVIGSVQVNSKCMPALKISLRQTLEYTVLAYGPPFAEIYAYCLKARQGTKTQLEVYAPCFLIRDIHDDTLVPVVSSLNWYISSTWRQQCTWQVDAIMHGEAPKDAAYPLFVKNVLARFSDSP